MKKRIVAKNKTGKNIPTYKKSSKGACPDQDDSSTLHNVYWNKFGCIPHTNRAERETKGINAHNCAAERLTYMYDRILENDPVDAEHIRPIKLAYDMSKNCLKNTLYYNGYIEKFKNYYKELIKGNPEIHILFQTALGNGEYPFDNNVKNITNRIESSIQTNSSRIHNPIVSNNPIIFTNIKTQNNKQNQKQLTKKNKKVNVLTLI